MVYCKIKTIRPDLAAITIISTVFFLVFGAYLIVMTPPFAGPDEPFHWKRSLQIAQGNFLAEELGPNSWGGPIDQAGFHYWLYFLDLIKQHAPVDAEKARM